MRRRRRERAEVARTLEPAETNIAETGEAIPSQPEVASAVPELPAETPTPEHRRGLPFVVNWGALLVVVVLIAATVFVLLLNQGILPAEVIIYWPLAVAVPSVLWLLVALVRRNARSVMAAAALFGVSISLLLASLKVPLGSTLVGITFITTGAGIMLRGLLLRNQPV
jgi:hypothetical protein